MRNRNMEKDMAEDRHFWRLGVYGRFLANNPNNKNNNNKNS
jgi:hypothetical protein